MSRTSYIIMREKRLVEKSSIADLPEYAGLVAVLSRYDIVNDRVLESDDSIDEATIYTIKNTWGALVQNAADEWQFYNSADKKSKCMLDNKDIKTEYYIKNKVNGNQLTVGSECVKHFGFENGLLSGVTSRSYIVQQQREQRRIRKREAITKLYGNIERQVNGYYTQISDSPVLLNAQLFHTANGKIDALKKFYGDYVDSRERDAMLYPDLQQAVETYLNDVVKPWVKKQTSELFACTLEDFRHLEANGHADIISRIRNSGGLLDEETAAYMYHPGFIQKHLETFREKLASCFRVIQLRPSGMAVAFESDEIVGIDYSVSLKNFLEMFGGVLFGKPVALPFPVYYPKCSFVDTSENRWELMESLYNYFRGSDYDFLYDEEKYHVVLAGSGKYCETLSVTSLVSHVIPKLAMKQSIAQMENTFFDRLKWIRMDSLSKTNIADVNDMLKKLRKTRSEWIENI